jgi:hypothetical protein
MKLIKISIASIFLMASCLSAMANTPSSAMTPSPDQLAIQVFPATDVLIIQSSARRGEGTVAVEGQVRRKIIGGRGVVKGHVDVKLLNKKGETIHEVFASCSPRIIPNRGTLTSSFSARIPMVAPPESVISMRFHNGHHDG